MFFETQCSFILYKVQKMQSHMSREVLQSLREFVHNTSQNDK